MATPDQFPYGKYDELATPARRAFAITPSNSADLTEVTRSLYIGAGGDLAVILDGDTVAVTFVAVPTGTVLPIRAKLVKSTGTTAASIVGLA